MTGVYSLPPEILHRIGLELSPNDLLNTLSTCKFLSNCFAWNSDYNDKLFWRQYCKVNYRVLLEDEKLDDFKERLKCQLWRDLSQQLSTLDRSPSYHKQLTHKLGCDHYTTDAKIISFCCNKLFGCRHCHDVNVKDHRIDR
jgi:hypothetical protein